eukprot:CAMPEP_0197907224 /NCGR_PEP_ID=MMETSP1439-20131203/64404_1 /TAXON_ID=66791 /ORGANISM="Gonyaulax spinifera, Strain CCMP409" /LENGTH=37 /DNA_ID= /DNA_START= /DNA_END= /DNA_ORIENTATION=
MCMRPAARARARTQERMRRACTRAQEPPPGHATLSLP